MICDECETVAHCLKNGCVPKHQALDRMAENARELGLGYEPAPVHFAWMRYEADCAGEPMLVLARSTEEGAFKVYKEPPAAKRQWVHATPWRGLTDEEFIDLCEEASNFGTGGLIRHIEAKLKAKNCD
jgi:hypothetical protein